jgi:glyoxylase-like metal-dependent hydrolase (beta-lactamase superfamily II)/rhodanese-related sulfurtransferase
MYIQQLYTGCLAEAAYYIESNGEAAIIDPLRETQPYIDLATERGAKIKYIFETHFHADFVSGHIDLSNKTGAPIVYGPTAETSFEIIKATDGQKFKLGELVIEILHTPGHTPESSCYLLYDASGKPHSIYTGDTLFIGDVGRPDLAQKGGDITAEDMAATLYDSLREKIMPLPDHIIVYPAHGAGSACGKNMSNETSALLGDQKRMNYALGDISKEEFVKELTSGILPPPQYFAKAAAQNKKGYKSIDDVFSSSLTPLNVEQLEERQNNGALVIDTRREAAYSEGHVPNSWFIGLHGQFAPWAGALITDMHQPIVIIAEDGKAEEAIMRLARVGYDNVVGYLEGGFEAWIRAGKPIKQVPSISPEDFVSSNPLEPVIDVRKQSEYDNCHLPNAQLLTLDYIMEHLSEVNPKDAYFIHCKGGYRSVIAWSILASKGFSNITDIRKGFDGLKAAGAAYTQTVEA